MLVYYVARVALRFSFFSFVSRFLGLFLSSASSYFLSSLLETITVRLYQRYVYGLGVGAFRCLLGRLLQYVSIVRRKYCELSLLGIYLRLVGRFVLSGERCLGSGSAYAFRYVVFIRRGSGSSEEQCLFEYYGVVDGVLYGLSYLRGYLT